MERWSGLLLAVLVPALAFDCGGKTSSDGNDGGQQASSGSGGGSGAGSSSGSGGGFGSGSGGGSGGGGSGAGSGGGSGAGSGSSSGGGAPVDAEPIDDAPIVVDDAEAPACVSNGTSGSGGQGSCEVAVSETCRDGNTYAVTCQCPQAACYCTQSNSHGGSSGGGVSYSGCPSCNVTDGLYTLCGFPQ